jgi:hypothetical protein
LDGRRVRVEKYQVELGHRNQLKEVSQYLHVLRFSAAALRLVMVTSAARGMRG